MNKNDYLSSVEGCEFMYSLNKMTGKKVVDVLGAVDQNFDVPVFAVWRLVFDDGTVISVEGEHDIAYLPCNDKVQGVQEDFLNELAEE